MELLVRVVTLQRCPGYKGVGGADSDRGMDMLQLIGIGMGNFVILMQGSGDNGTQQAQV